MARKVIAELTMRVDKIEAADPIFFGQGPTRATCYASDVTGTASVEFVVAMDAATDLLGHNVGVLIFETEDGVRAT